MTRSMKMGKKNILKQPLRTTTSTLGDQRPANGLDCSLHDRLMAGTSAQTILQ
jgi:hypothetical protein